MTNTYGYNRKTPEEDKKIIDAVRRHHNIVEAEGRLVVLTALVGSQNYDLDDENSDIDTFSFVFPTITELAEAHEPYSGLTIVEDGHCNVKDIRVALNLLKKASPNSVEYFASKYKVYNPMFEDILKEYLDNNERLWKMIHCNFKHMLYAMAGMAHQLTKRNMPAGKRFAHALRLDNMYYHYMNSFNAGAVLDMRAGGDRDLALLAKRDADQDHEMDYNEQCEQIAAKLDLYRDGLEMLEDMRLDEERGKALIDSFQWKLFKKYMMETNLG